MRSSIGWLARSLRSRICSDIDCGSAAREAARTATPPSVSPSSQLPVPPYSSTPDTT